MSIFNELKRRNVIRVALAYLAGAWLLIQIADTVFPAYDLPISALNVLITTLAIGFVPILLVAWAFEWTSQGIMRDAGVADSVAPHSSRGLDRFIVVALALALGFFVFDKFVLDPARDDAEMDAAIEVALMQARKDALFGSYGNKSIAVLPFINMSPDPDQTFFADGISEELINLLAKIPELRVISRSSAFSIRGDDINIPDVARKLDVAHVLEGSVRRSGDKIRITAQLIEAETDTHLWSSTYDREIDDLFSIQDEIARIVVDELEIELLGSLPTARRTDPKSYALFLQARNLIYRGDVDDVRKAEALLRQVLERDPDFVPALTGLVMAIFFQTGDNPDSAYSREEAPPLIFDLLSRALAIDPNDGVANAYLAGYNYEAQRDLTATAELVEIALANGPANPEVLRMTAGFAKLIGRFDESVLLAQRAAELDPLCVVCLFDLSLAYLFAGRLDEAESTLRHFQVFRPQGGWLSLGRILLLRGEPEAALAAFETRKSSGAFWQSSRALALFDLGRIAEFESTLADAIDRGAESGPVDIARVYAWTGDVDSAFVWLDKAFGNSIEDFHFIVWDPVFRKLHEDARWLALRERAGLGPELLAAIEFDILQ